MATHPKIGQMDSRIVFQTSVKVQNAQFGFDYTWQDDFTVWARIKQNPGLLFTRGDNGDPIITHLIYVRQRNNINREQRIMNNGNEYVIHRMNVMEEGNKRFIELHVEQKDTQA